MLSVIKTKKSESFLPDGYELKTGSINYTDCNNNANIIPVRINVFMHSGNGGYPYIKYVTVNVLTLHGYFYGYDCSAQSASISLYSLSELKNATKLKISATGDNLSDWTCKVTEWLEKKTGGAIAKLLLSLSHLLKREVALC